MRICKASAERWRLVRYTKLGCHTEWTGGDFRDKCFSFLFWRALLARLLVLWWVWVGSLDLYKTFGADGLIATARPVQIGRIVEEANRALGSVFVQIDFQLLTIDAVIIGQANFLGCEIW
jgi:hypothetical protein